MGLHSSARSADLGVPQIELERVAGEEEVWNTLLRLLSLDLISEKRKKMDGWMDVRKALHRNSGRNITTFFFYF